MQTVFVLRATHIEYIWTWLTSVFAHAHPLHLLVNSVVVASFGVHLERELGAKPTLSVFFAGGICAGLAQVLVGALMSGTTVGVLGASGGALALVGAIALYAPQTKILILPIPVPIPIWIAVSLFFVGSLAVALLFGVGAFGVAHIAHLTGLSIGIGYGFVHFRNTPPGQI